MAGKPLKSYQDAHEWSIIIYNIINGLHNFTPFDNTLQNLTAFDSSVKRG